MTALCFLDSVGNLKRQGLAAALLFASMLIVISPARAQYEYYDPLIKPSFQQVDSNGIDLATGIFSFSESDLAIGSGEFELRHSLSTKGGYFFSNNLNMIDNWSMVLVTKVRCKPLDPSVTNCAAVDTGVRSAMFQNSSGSTYARTYGGTFISQPPETLVLSGSTYTYTDPNGIQYIFGPDNSVAYGVASNILHNGFNSTGRVFLVNKIIYPKGLTVSVYYKWYNNYARKQSVFNSAGYMIKYNYSSPIENVANGSNTASISPSSITVINRAIEWCDGAADQCSLTRNWPTTLYNYNDASKTLVISRADGSNQTVVLNTNLLPTSISTPFGTRSIGYRATVAYATAGTYVSPINDVNSFNDNGSTWSYQLRPVLNNGTLLGTRMTATDPLNTVVSFSTDYTSSQTTYGYQPAGKPIPQYQTVDQFHRPLQLSNFEKNVYNYGLDLYGNPTSASVQTTGPNPLTIGMTAQYDTPCVILTKCNSPNWTKDPNGNQTDFQYDPATGILQRKSEPADANGVRPVTRYTFIQRYAWQANGLGGFVQASNSVWLLSQTKTCRASATVSDSCAAGASDEVLTSYDYGPDSGVAGNNLLLRGVTVTADGRSERTCYGYDDNGRRIWASSPNAGRSACY